MGYTKRWIGGARLLIFLNEPDSIRFRLDTTSRIVLESLVSLVENGQGLEIRRSIKMQFDVVKRRSSYRSYYIGTVSAKKETRKRPGTVLR